ncbi:MAG: putative Ig domain-containing protein, partial [Chthoniobacterales bacterium]
MLVAIILAAFPCRLGGYALNGNHWPDGTQIQMHLGLNLASGPLQDGSASWNASATDALSIWNQYISAVQFVAASATTPMDGDGVNSVFFSNTIYGQSFGSSTLAVTTHYSTSGVFSEADVIFNTHFKWNSYRGPLQGGGTTGTYDFHRVALHEFGHVLGLDHPDDHGQSVVAIMNSVTSDLDHLADDDIAGARFLYGLKITSSQSQQSVLSGNPFSYHITASNNPTSYSATGLPPGIQVNTATGLISGSCPISGNFTVNITVQGSGGVATGSFLLQVDALRLTSPFYAPDVLIGDSLSYQVTADNNPTSFTATNLPSGLTIDPNTGVISGIATVTGQFQVYVVASGATAQAAGT